MDGEHCDGCLGRRSCWVCLGTGNADTLRRLGVCPSCGGSARCAYCLPHGPRVVIDLRDRGVAAGASEIGCPAVHPPVS